MKKNRLSGSTMYCNEMERSSAGIDAFKRFFFLMFLLVSVAFSNVSYAQEKTVTGIVTDSSGAAVQGASIAVKGAKNATASGPDGRFSITVPSNNSVLAVSYVGTEQQELKVGAGNSVNVTLRRVSAATQEVVVVGYGTQRKATLTGSVSTVNAKTFQDRGPVASPLAALQGQVAGVTVTRSSAQPGRENWNFQVRGATSANGTEPLIIIDGLPVPSSSALNSLNPADIENISFLKDASASIYGARAAGGVVLITTKRARSGKAIIEYSGSVSRKKVGLQPKLTDINGWGPLMYEARFTNDQYPVTDAWVTYANISMYAKQHGKDWLTRGEWLGLVAPTGPFPNGFVFGDVREYVFFNGTMQDYLWGDATSNEHQLSISSRGDKGGYRISMGYLNDGSLLQTGNNSNKRYNLRLAHDYQVSSKMTLQSNISLEKNDIVQPTGIGAVLNNGIQPGIPISAQNGKPYIWGSGIPNASTYNIAQYGGDNKEANTRLNTNFNLTYNFSKDLKAVGSAGYYFLNTDYRTREEAIDWYDYTGTELLSKLTPSGGSRSSYQRGARKEAYYNLNAYLEYAKVFGDHDIKLMGGSQYERDEVNSFLAKTLDPVPGVPSSLSLSTSTDAGSKTLSEAQNHYALAGYFSRLNYAYKGKYLFEANARYDGSSKFISSNRWKLFYGFLAAWRIKQEKFMENVSFLNDLKLRASWGTVGNQSGIGLYDYIQFMNLNYSQGQTSSGFPIIGNSPVVRVAPGGLVALDRTWETVQTSNIGVDIATLKNRLSGTFDYYIKRNKNMLIARTFPAALGANAPQGNNGELKTWGWELSLNWRDRIGDVGYHIGGNLSDNQNRLVNYGGQTLISSANRGYNSAVEGYSLGTYFGLDYAGRIQTQKQLDDYKALFFAPGTNINTGFSQTSTLKRETLQLGDNMFRDVNGDGKITFPEDAVVVGRDDPRYSYSFNGGLDWKGFDLNVIFQGIGQRTIIRDGNWRIPGAVVFQAQNAAFDQQWWTPARTDAYLPRISTTGTINNYNYYPSNWVAENGSYIRLKNLVVGYTLPKSLTQKAKIEKLRVYFSGNDLWEKSHIRDGWDPEAPRSVANIGDPNNGNVSTFSERYPFYRYMTFGVNVTF
jgi:TonB-linked SusC/RagA family outer membrane protein